MFTEQPSERTWSTTSGWQDVGVWEGPSEELDDFLENTAPPGYIYARISKRPLGEASVSDSTMSYWVRVELTYGIAAGGGDAGLISRTWSLHPVDEQQSILSHDATIPLWNREKTWPLRIKAAAEDYYNRLIQALTSNPSGSTSGLVRYEPAAPVGATSGEIAQASRLFDILVRDSSAAGFVTRYTLRKTEVVNTLTALKAAHANVNRPYTYSGLTSAETTLPSAALIDAAGLSGYKWLKRTPQVEQVAGGLFQIVQEWESGVYFEPYLYGSEIT